MDGRILFYNPQTGQGKLILKSEEKMDFSADLWDNFDVIPSAGKLVACKIEKGLLTSVNALSSGEDVKAAPNIFEDSMSDEEVKEGEESTEKDPPVIKKDPTFSVHETIENYFEPIAIFVGDPPDVVNTKAQLDYFRVQRFLLTAYNDLKGLDHNLHNNREIKSLLEEIKQLDRAYTTLDTRLKSPKLAFEMIFLRSQPEYLHYIRYNEHCISRISILGKIEVSLFPDIKAKEEILKKIPAKGHDDERYTLDKEIKAMRRMYVDTIHENAGLYENLSTMDDIKKIYTEKYFDNFLSELMKLGGKYLERLKSVLNYRAYKLDKIIWESAENSKHIKEHLRSADIKGKYSTLTFLRYYLNTLDKRKLSSENRELFELEEYLIGLETPSEGQ